MDQIIKDNNRLIAEFLGMTQGKHNEPRWQNDWFDDKNFINGNRNEKLLFDHDWNWLMPVIMKISTLDLPDPDGVSESWQPFPRTFGMINDDTGEFMFRFNRHAIYEAPDLLNAAYTAVIAFLQSSAYTEYKQKS